MAIKDLKPGEHFITVNRGMAGYFACDMWIAPEGYIEPYETVPGRYPLYRSAEIVAMQVADDLGYPFFPGEEQADLEDTGKTVGDLFRSLGFEVIEIGGGKK